VASSSQQAPPGKHWRAPRGARSSPGGNRREGCVRGLEAEERPPSPGLGLRARARLPPTPHFSSVPRPGPRRPDVRGALWVAAPLAAAWGPVLPARRPGTPSFLTGPSLRPRRLPPTRRLYLLLERAEGVEAGAASSRASERAARVRSPFPPPPLRSRRGSARRGAGEQLWPRGTRGECAGRGDTAALRPAGEEQPHRSSREREREREGGRQAEWGGVSRSRQWLPRRQVDRRPPPPPRRDLWFVPGLRQGRARGPAPWGRPGGPEPLLPRLGPTPQGSPKVCRVPATPAADQGDAGRSEPLRGRVARLNAGPGIPARISRSVNHSSWGLWGLSEARKAKQTRGRPGRRGGGEERGWPGDRDHPRSGADTKGPRLLRRGRRLPGPIPRCRWPRPRNARSLCPVQPEFAGPRGKKATVLSSQPRCVCHCPAP
jgi:hypothetical protein